MFKKINIDDILLPSMVIFIINMASLSFIALGYRELYNYSVISHLQDRGPLFHYRQDVYVKGGFYRGKVGKIVENNLEDYGSHSNKKPEYFYYIYDDKIKMSLKLRESDLEPLDKSDE